MARKNTPATACCVLYDPARGRIAHTHTVVRFDDGRTPASKALEAEVRATFSRQPHHRKGLQALHVPSGALEPEGEYRVDPVKRVLRRQPANTSKVKAKIASAMAGNRARHR